jgi:copper(I)-binding protein
MSMLVAMLFWSTITARGVINPIVVAAPSGAGTSLYFVLRNSSRNEDRLVRVTCACAGRIEVLRARGGDPGLDTQSVAMPPARLVELRPGGRHMFVLGLRRPLVAGETVEMTFHYAQGAETRAVRIVADAQAGWAEGLARTGPRQGPRRLAPLESLAGACWRGSFPHGRRTETRCFSPTYGNFMQDWLVVEGGTTPSVTWTLYSHDVMGRSTRYEYSGPDGARRAGRVVPTDEGVTFADYPQQTPTGERSAMLVRTHWRRDGADAWLVVAETQRSAGWRELWRLRMVRAGPAQPF